jgi:hypothetical protein
MTVPTATPAVESYLGRVRLALSDLPDDDRQDLLEDLRGHLVELTSEEPGVDLATRLGRPETYADELRQSAGLPARSGKRRPPLTAASVVEAVKRFPGGAALLGYLPLLRPAWWVARAWGALYLVDWTVHDAGGYRWGSGAIPEIHGSKAIGSLVLAVLVVVSLRFGLSAVGSKGWYRKALVVANLALIVLTPLYFANTSNATDPPFVQVSCCGELTGENDQYISNIYAYDEHGKLIPRVQLFDQQGKPINLSNNEPGAPLHNVFPQPENPVSATMIDKDGTVTVLPTPTHAPSVAPLAPTASP